jgi:hypothetical protein
MLTKWPHVINIMLAITATGKSNRINPCSRQYSTTTIICWESTFDNFPGRGIP